MTAPDLTPAALRALADRLALPDERGGCPLEREAAAALRALAAEREAVPADVLETLRQLVMGIGAAISRSSKHDIEVAYNRLRDYRDHLARLAPPAPGGPHG